MDHDFERRRKEEAHTVAEQAAAWLIELEAAGVPQHEAFLKWLAESPPHIEAFLWASAVDRLLAHVDPQREIAIDSASFKNVIPMQAAKPQSPAGKASPFRWRWAAAAALLTLVAGGGWLYFTPSSSWRSYSTSIGEQRSLQLADGSKIYINTGSRLQVHLSPRTREVRLLAGEALFDVQHDPTRPFRVHSGGTIIQAVGTQFDVYRRSTATTVSVIEGKVRISSQAQAKAPAEPTLAAGEQASVAADGGIVRSARIDTVRVTAWRQRRLLFTNDTLEDIAAQFNRYNRSPQIRVADTAAGARRYAAGFDADKPESLVQVLADDPTLEVERQAGAVVVRSREEESNR